MANPNRTSHPIKVSVSEGSLPPCDENLGACGRYAQGEMVIDHSNERVLQIIGGIGCEACEFRVHIGTSDRNAFGFRVLTTGPTTEARDREKPRANHLLTLQALRIIER